MPKPKRIMDAFKLDEVSFVTRPAQEAALAAIQKSDLSDAEIEAVLVDDVLTKDGVIVEGDDAEAFAAFIEALIDELEKNDKVIPEEATLADLFKMWGEDGGDPVNKGDTNMPGQNKTAEELQADLTKAQDDLKKSEAKAAEQEVLAKMSDAEKQFMSKMPEDKRKEFMDASAEERKAAMSKAGEDDPVVYKSLDGDEFRKSDDPRLVNAIKKADGAAKIAKAAEDKLAKADLEKRADSELGELPGETAHKAALLKSVDDIEDEEVRKGVMGILKSKAEAFGKSDVTSTFGKSGIGEQPGETMTKADAHAKLESLAKDLQKADPKLDDMDAYSKAADMNPDLYDLAVAG